MSSARGRANARDAGRAGRWPGRPRPRRLALTGAVGRAADRAQPLFRRSARGAVAQRPRAGREAGRGTDPPPSAGPRRLPARAGRRPLGFSATMRTAGEEFAMALHLAGLAPRWDEGSARVSGFEIVPLALLGRPRIDVTLRVSGLFRDVFPAWRSCSRPGPRPWRRRDEAPEDNPYAARAARVFGPEAGALRAWHGHRRRHLHRRRARRGGRGLAARLKLGDRHGRAVDPRSPRRLEARVLAPTPSSTRRTCRKPMC
jgi:hypothetical protein